ncbi:MAG TPA: hypothetical protein VES02_02480, partial [Dermatophilaceae bacterium]|nr:hypothetical protein [Dermatophilaceae bacterium]
MNALARGGLSLVLGLGAAALSVGCSAPQGESEVTVTASQAIWVPEPGVSWQLQFSGTVDTSVEAEVFDIDGAD